jgi:hypothetical protein
MKKVIVPPKYSSQSVIMEVDQMRGEGKPETFPFLGFTHFCGQRIRDGAFIVWRITRRSGWSRSSKPSRLSFNAGSIIARPRSVHGFRRLCWATTNAMPFRWGSAMVVPTATIGALLCASKDDAVVENGLSRTLSPALIAGQLAELRQRSNVC